MRWDGPHIHWVAPLPPAETDIANYTHRILPELSERADITLWTDASSWNPKLTEYCPVRRLNPETIIPGEMRGKVEGSADGDVIFVHMGNSGVFHAGFLQLVCRIPTIIVLHDLALQEMYFYAISKGFMSLDGYLDEIDRWYGNEGQKEVRLSWDGKVPAYKLSQRIPGFEFLMKKAVAIVTHSSASHAAVIERSILPAYQLELPYRARTAASCERSTDGPLRLMQFGYIGPNRRLEDILQALADLGPDFEFIFDICGKLWDPEKIKLLCEQLGLTDKINFHGFVPEPQLDGMLAEAHLVFNLRNPTMGEASGSQLRIWDAAAASVVTDDGWYANISAETVFHIPKGNEVLSLKALLPQLSQDRQTVMLRGKKGREQLITKHDPETYADGIIQVAQNFSRDAHDAVLADAARRFIGGNHPQADLLRDRLSMLF